MSTRTSEDVRNVEAALSSITVKTRTSSTELSAVRVIESTTYTSSLSRLKRANRLGRKPTVGEVVLAVYRLNIGSTIATFAGATVT